uniref:Uncharacterized protein n=1 Tax=Globisporangium ultimum (strain ATCC 200006 / CBS 805.95 / DAOM BR144) TaxID=431595 RepID=K3X820_GLOUD
MHGCHAKVHNGTSPISHPGQTQAIHRSNAHSNVHSQRKTQQQRELLEGLGCDLQIYKDFVDSDEGQDIFLMATMCESRILYAKNRRAGFYGPVEQADLRLVMCSDECLKSDTLHQLAMSRSRCSCAQVSATTFVAHDFCLESSARLLCTHLGECGHWKCELEDFMCLRYEWDKLYPCESLRIAGNMTLLLGCFMALLLLM